jgi:hypothetical protein
MEQTSLKHLFDLIPAAVLGGLLGFLGSVITVAVTWVKDRNLDARCIQVIDEATKYVQFWDQRQKALLTLELSESVIAANKTTALTEISAATTFLVERLRRLQNGNVVKPIPTSKIRRWYMLYRPNRQITWFIRAFFYLYAFSGVLFAIEGLVFSIIGLEGLPRLLILLIGVIAPVSAYLFAWPIRLLAEWFDQKKPALAVIAPADTTDHAIASRGASAGG